MTDVVCRSRSSSVNGPTRSGRPRCRPVAQSTSELCPCTCSNGMSRAASRQDGISSSGAEAQNGPADRSDARVTMTPGRKSHFSCRLPISRFSRCAASAALSGNPRKCRQNPWVRPAWVISHCTSRPAISTAAAIRSRAVPHHRLITSWDEPGSRSGQWNCGSPR